LGTKINKKQKSLVLGMHASKCEWGCHDLVMCGDLISLKVAVINTLALSRRVNHPNMVYGVKRILMGLDNHFFFPFLFLFFFSLV
jgi:fructose-1,6-bisphosphatase